MVTLDGLALCTHPVESIGYWLRNSAAFCKLWNEHHRVAPADSCSHDAWAASSSQSIDYVNVDDAVCAYTTNCLFGRVSVIVLGTLDHSTANSDAPHRNPENRETHYRSAIFHQLKISTHRVQKNEKIEIIKHKGNCDVITWCRKDESEEKTNKQIFEKLFWECPQQEREKKMTINDGSEHNKNNAAYQQMHELSAIEQRDYVQLDVHFHFLGRSSALNGG